METEETLLHRPEAELDEEPTEEDEDARYEVIEVLGQGGMGEVRLCRDHRIGRDVAMKVLAGGEDVVPEARIAFVREARLQAQLEHPGVVPVHELGAEGDGAPYFTMKRVRGTTLAQILDGLAAGDRDTRARWSPARLIGAFATACLTVDYAHTRGILHLDLKPQNLMLGDFGEVYVLDWGVAQRGARDARGRAGGTPAYMAPEQAESHARQPATHARLDARADVWALGAILTEIVSLERFDANRTSRPEHVPPELWRICRRATAPTVDARFGSARGLHDAVIRWLDRRSDDERCRAQATAYVRSAETMLREAGDSIEGRGRAMAYLGRALALDPHHRHALRATVDLIKSPVPDLPSTVRESIAASNDEADREASRASVGPLVYTLLVGLVVLWMGVRSWALMGAWFALIALDVILEHGLSREGGWLATPTRRRAATWATVFTSMAAFALLSRAFGPLLVMPGVLAAVIITASVGGDLAVRRVSIALAVVTVLVPFGLELAGVLSPSYVFDERGLTIVPNLLSLPEVPTLVMLLLIAVGVILVPAWLVARVRDALSRAERQVHLQAWHLGRMIPDAARDQISMPRVD